MPNACAHWSWSYCAANRLSSWYCHPVMIHSGEYSFAVAAFVIGATIVVVPIRMTEVTPESLSFATSVGACSWAAAVWAPDEESAGGVARDLDRELGHALLGEVCLELVEVDGGPGRRRDGVEEAELPRLRLEVGVAGEPCLLAGDLLAEPGGDVLRLQVGVVAGESVGLLREVGGLVPGRAEGHHDLALGDLGGEHGAARRCQRPRRASSRPP